MNALRAFVAGLFDAIFKWGQSQSEKPPTTKDANTPKDVRDNLGGAYRDWVRDKDNRGN